MNLKVLALALSVALTSSVAYAENQPAAEEAAAPAQTHAEQAVEADPAATEEAVTEANAEAPAAASTEEAAPSEEKVAPQEAAPASSNSMQGRVEKNVLTGADILDVAESAGVLEKSIPGKYKAVQYTLTNRHKGYIEVLQGEVLNAVEESVAAVQAVKSSNSKKRVGGALLRGVAGGMSFIPVVGIGTAYASSAAHQVAGAAAHAADVSANNSMAATTGRYNKRISGVLISPNETYSFTALVPKNESPKVKVVFKDVKTNEIYDVRK
jgi:hypothetical protein